jgi:hypothetical protein
MAMGAAVMKTTTAQNHMASRSITCPIIANDSERRDVCAVPIAFPIRFTFDLQVVRLNIGGNRKPFSEFDRAFQRGEVRPCPEMPGDARTCRQAQRSRSA